MKQKVKNKLLAMAAIEITKQGILAILLILLGVTTGYFLANKECEPCEPCTVGFAAYEDMVSLIEELHDCGCKGY
tara:strand:- start:3496 stop:3720 length:225 start_codon:yes stop_codon:yes gene_type:complete